MKNLSFGGRTMFVVLKIAPMNFKKKFERNAQPAPVASVVDPLVTEIDVLEFIASSSPSRPAFAVTSFWFWLATICDSKRFGVALIVVGYR
jgi:hypothetical protein